jgi:transcriptional regulator with XRE-family HTH domain
MGNTDSIEHRLSARLATLRAERGLSLDDLAVRTGLSRATLSRIERAETSPTATMLGKLCAAYGWTLSRLMAAAEAAPTGLMRQADQPCWTDPETGFIRRVVSPPAPGLAMELVQATLPEGARIAYDAPPVPGMEQHVLLLDGALAMTVDAVTYDLAPGDCLRMRLTGAAGFESRGPGPARYLIAICQSGGAA